MTTPFPRLTRLVALSTRHERSLAIGIAVALTLFRSVVFVVYEEAAFDSDQALLGLMAKHLSELRAFPVLTYAHDYMLGIEAWLAAPLFWIAGPSVAMLKLPLLLMNLAIVVLLIIYLEREMNLRPWLGLVASLFFVLPHPGTTTMLLAAIGGNIEPFLAVLLLWTTRNRPLVFGSILALGYLNRQFTAYGLAALLLLEIADGSLFRWAALRVKLVALIAFTAVWETVQLLNRYSSAAGPGTSFSPMASSSEGLSQFFCWNPATLPGSLSQLFGEHLGILFGGGESRSLLSFGINSTLEQGSSWLWPVVGGTLLFALVRVGWMTMTRGVRPWQGELRFGVYLLIIGLQAGVIYAMSGCGLELTVGQMRYSLLALFAAVGLTACYMKVETSRTLKALVIAVVTASALLALVTHANLLDEYVRHTPASRHRVLADYLQSNGIRYGYADFWDADATVFLSQERVILASTTEIFINEYQWLVRAHGDEAVWVLNEPCRSGGTQVGAYYVCRPDEMRPEEP